MLKLFAILSVALALTVNPGKKDQSPDQAKRDSGNNGTPTAAALLDDKISTPDTKSAKAESPPWYTSAEWWLFILGIPTLIVIAFQAIASKQAAEAALLNAKALISSERPWLVVSIERSEYEQPDVFIVRIHRQVSRVGDGGMGITWKVSHSLRETQTSMPSLNQLRH